MEHLVNTQQVKLWSTNVRYGPLPNVCTKDMVECSVWSLAEYLAKKLRVGFLGLFSNEGLIKG
jgi:hypothetical protein